MTLSSNQKSIEEIFNSALSEVLGDIRPDWAKFLKSEKRQTLAEGGRVDILLDNPSSSSALAIECSNSDKDANKDAINRLGKRLKGSNRAINTAIAVAIPQPIMTGTHKEIATELKRNRVKLRYALYTNTAQNRFPNDGFIEGDVYDLAGFIAPSLLPANVVESSANALEQGTNDVSGCLAGLPVERRDIIAQLLRQPDSTQTHKMAGLIMINALAYQQILADIEEGVPDVTVSTTKPITRGSVIEAWDTILQINYWPIFSIARNILGAIPYETAAQLLQYAAKTAYKILPAIRASDVAGSVFQRLITDRKKLATFYTRPVSALLAAHLAIPENLDWGKPETMRNYHIADYACGTGGLLLAAYQRVRELAQRHGNHSSDDLHDDMMRDALTGSDIMPAAIHLTATLLSSAVPGQRYKGTRCVLYDYGPTDEGIALGALKLLGLRGGKPQSEMPLGGEMAMGAEGVQQSQAVAMEPESQDLVIMNPPFTASTNHTGVHKTTHNPAFAAFQTSPQEQAEMKNATRKLSIGTIGDHYAGLGSHFAAIAHNMVKPGGRIVLILPISSMQGGSWDGNQVWSWQKLRQLLALHYTDIVVVTIAHDGTAESSFSADTDIREALIIARRRIDAPQPNERTLAHFVNLQNRPTNPLEAREYTRAIKHTLKTLTREDVIAKLKIGGDKIGEVIYARAHPLARWSMTSVRNLELMKTAKALTLGSLRLPSRSEPLAIPMTQLGKIAQVGPVHRAITLAFERDKGCDSGTEYPMLWARDNRAQAAMETPCDSSGTIKEGKEQAAQRLWETASRLCICWAFRFNANSTCAVITAQKSLGGNAWTTLRLPSEDLIKAACVWFNSTLGMLCYWEQSNRTQSGRGMITVTAMPNIAMLNVCKLDTAQLSAIVSIYNDVSTRMLLPAHQAYKDNVRCELDRRLLVEVLGYDDTAVEQLGTLRKQWCLEPSVRGTKKKALRS